MTTAVPAQPRRLGGVPAAVGLAIAGAWGLAIGAQATGSAGALQHDALIGQGSSLWPGLALSLLAWQAFLGDALTHAMIEASPRLQAHEWRLGGIVLALAGAFQFTPLKEACLRQCRHPGAFLLRHYARGARGGFALGARHGAFCVGCCWALMLVMFAVGVANLVWMGVLTALVVHGKTRPRGARAVPVTGVALLAAASIMLLYSACVAGPLS